MDHFGFRRSPSVYVRLVPPTIEEGLLVMEELGYHNPSMLRLGDKKPVILLPTYRVNREKYARVFEALRARGIMFWS
jgi:hypothetical protein